MDGTAACQEKHVDVMGMTDDFPQKHLPLVAAPRALNGYSPILGRNFRITQVLGIKILTCPPLIP